MFKNLSHAIIAIILLQSLAVGVFMSNAVTINGNKRKSRLAEQLFTLFSLVTPGLPFNSMLN